MPSVLHVDKHLAFVTLAVILFVVLVWISPIADVLQQLLLLLPLCELEGEIFALRWILQVPRIRHLVDHLEGVTLIDQKLLAFVRIVHFLRVCADERVEECVEIGHVCCSLLLCILLGAKNAPKPLCFLLAGTEVGRDLNDHVGGWQVNRGVTNLADEDRVDVVILLEVGEDVHAFELVRLAVDKGTLEGLG